MLTIIKPPSEVVGLQEIKAHLRLDHAEEDDYLMQLIRSATDLVENFIGRSLLIRTYQKIWSPSEDLKNVHKISLNFPPLVEVMSVTGIGRGNQRRAIKRYLVQMIKQVPFIEVFPFDFQAIEVVYQAGYGHHPATVPSLIRQGICMTVAQMYENRLLSSLNLNIQQMLHPYRIREMRTC